jgi:lipopolysaccharide transport system ATP-binding protein
MKPAIQFENLSKVYRLGAHRGGDRLTLREAMVNAAAAPWRRLRSLCSPRRAGRDGGPPTHWALRDVSFDVQPGEVIGLIGRNGAGKSTLLKVLSQITEPTSGRVVFRGRVGSLLEVGTGFHQELTGRENIFLNGGILGMSRAEIRRKFDDIVGFADIGPFLDTPVKHYSSGMYVRLAFAVASHLEPEILVVDEVLAVGDAAFQRKCLGKMDAVSRSGRTVLFVSHSMAAIRNLCGRVAVLVRGQAAFVGGVTEGLDFYLNGCGGTPGGAIELAEHPQRRPGSKAILRQLRLLNAAGQPTDRFLCGEPLTLELEAETPSGTGHLDFAVVAEDAFGSRLFMVGTHLADSVLTTREGARHVLCRLGGLPLAPGRYALSLMAGPQLRMDADAIDQAAWFDVLESDYYGNGRLPEARRGPFLMRSQWEEVSA